MKHFVWISLFLTGSVFAQTVGAPVENIYSIPFPGSKTVPTNNWNLLIEVQSQSGEPYNVSVIQHDIRGRVINETNFGTQMGGQVFQWSSEAYRVNARVRSLSLSSFLPLTGTLWMWNDVFGQVNAVSLGGDSGNELTIPHIPEDFYSVTTTFAVVGAGGLSPSDLEFSYADSQGVFHAATRVRSNLPGNGYFIATPEWTLPIGTLGEDSTAVWGRIAATRNDFQMSGYQTFTREADRGGAPANQTGAVGLSSVGRDQGWLLFADNADMPFQHEFIFTNPSTERVSVELEMLVRELNAEDETFELVAHQAQLELNAYEKRILLLGTDVFSETSGERVWMRFNTVPPPVDEEVEPLNPPKIFALHAQTGGDNLLMGSHEFADAGNQIDTWIGFDPQLDTVLELVSSGRDLVIPVQPDEDGNVPEDAVPEVVREVSQYQIAFLDKEGQISVVNQTLDAGSIRTITPELLLETFAEVFGDGQPDPVSVRISLLSGPSLVAKMTAFGSNDIAIVNPRTTTIELVTEEEPPPTE